MGDDRALVARSSPDGRPLIPRWSPTTETMVPRKPHDDRPLASPDHRPPTIRQSPTNPRRPATAHHESAEHDPRTTTSTGTGRPERVNSMLVLDVHHGREGERVPQNGEGSDDPATNRVLGGARAVRPNHQASDDPTPYKGQGNEYVVTSHMHSQGKYITLKQLNYSGDRSTYERHAHRPQGESTRPPWSTHASPDKHSAGADDAPPAVERPAARAPRARFKELPR